MSFLSKEGLSYFFDKLKSLFLQTSGGTITDGSARTTITPYSIEQVGDESDGAYIAMDSNDHSYNVLLATSLSSDGKPLLNFFTPEGTIDITTDGIDFDGIKAIKKDGMFLDFFAQEGIKLGRPGKQPTPIRVTGVEGPEEDADAVNKKYVDDSLVGVLKSPDGKVVINNDTLSISSADGATVFFQSQEIGFISPDSFLIIDVDPPQEATNGGVYRISMNDLFGTYPIRITLNSYNDDMHPFEENDLVPKKYVDNAIANAGSDIDAITNEQIDAILAT